MARGKPGPKAEAESVQPRTRAAWRRWLERNHARSRGVWFVAFKKATGRPRVEYEEAVEEALCFGWIDSRTMAVDAERTAFWCSPRKPGSTWSRSNKERVARLVAAGRMTPAGLAPIEAAKRDGSWSALDAVDNLEVPPDLARALRANRAAKRHFDAFPPSARRGLLWWIVSAKRPETRAARVEKTVAMAAENRRATGAPGA